MSSTARGVIVRYHHRLVRDRGRISCEALKRRAMLSVSGTDLTGFQATSLTFKAGATAAGDLNNYGHLDAVVADADQDAKSFAVLLGNGDGTFAAPLSVTTSQPVAAVATAVFNGD